MITKTNIKTLLILALAVLLGSNSNIAQNVGIGAESFAPEQSAGLELRFTDKGFLPPRMTTEERDNIENIANGLLIFNISTGCPNYFFNGLWFELCGLCVPQAFANAGANQENIVGQVTLSANEPQNGTGIWTIISGAGGTLEDNEHPNSVLSGLAGEEYILVWTVSNSCGSSSDTVIIQFKPDACTGANDFGYGLVVIGEQCWQEKNLNIIPFVGNSWCYNNLTSNCEIYGRLYNWAAANTVCPTGWRLPSDNDWKALELYLGMTETQANATGWRGTNEGEKLKSLEGWANAGNETNASGFNGLPGGHRTTSGNFIRVTERGYWWSSTQVASNTWIYRYLDSASTQVYRIDVIDVGFSVRCIRN